MKTLYEQGTRQRYFTKLRIESNTVSQNSEHNSVESRNTSNKRVHLNRRNVG